MAAAAAKLGLPLALPTRNAAPSPLPPPLPRRHLAWGFSNPRRRRRNKRPIPRPAFSSLVETREGEGERLAFTDPEVRLIEGLLGIQGRGRAASTRQLKDVEQAVEALEGLKGVADPTSSSLIEGRWQLIFTTRPGTASPIQRTFVGVDIFNVFQEVYLRTDDPRVSNIVQFSNAVGELKVEAEATIKDGKRILFRFDRAAFDFRFLPFRVPYPVPFRLLGDEAKGWLDTTYLSQTGNIRISRGNKGTTFVLQKKTDLRQRLLSAISSSTGVMEVIDELVSTNQNCTSEGSHLLEGEWQLLWTSQLEQEGWSDTVSAGLKGLQIVRENGKVQNLVDLFPGVKLAAYGSFIKSNKSYGVTMHNGTVMIGAVKLPLDIERSYNMQLLYIDKKIRIARGYKEAIFVHICVNRTERD